MAVAVPVEPSVPSPWPHELRPLVSVAAAAAPPPVCMYVCMHV